MVGEPVVVELVAATIEAQQRSEARRVVVVRGGRQQAGGGDDRIQAKGAAA
jgi:hypothetical protein